MQVVCNGWRKWSVAVLAITLSFVLAIFGKLTGEFVTIATISVGAFSAGNVMEHYKK